MEIQPQVTTTIMTVGKPTAHLEHIDGYTLGFKICRGVPKAFFMFVKGFSSH